MDKQIFYLFPFILTRFTRLPLVNFTQLNIVSSFKSSPETSLSYLAKSLNNAPQIFLACKMRLCLFVTLGLLGGSWPLRLGTTGLWVI